MQYGISSSNRNLFAELSNSNPDDFADEYCDETSGKRYIYGDDVNDCGYEFLPKSVEPDVDFPIVKSEEIKIKEEVQDLDSYTTADVWLQSKERKRSRETKHYLFLLQISVPKEYS